MIIMLAWYKCHEVLQTNYATFFFFFYFIFFREGVGRAVSQSSVCYRMNHLCSQGLQANTPGCDRPEHSVYFSSFLVSALLTWLIWNYNAKKNLWIMGTYNESLQNYSFRTFLYLSRAPVLIALQEVPKLSCFANICKRLDLASSSNRESEQVLVIFPCFLLCIKVELPEHFKISKLDHD